MFLSYFFKSSTPFSSPCWTRRCWGTSGRSYGRRLNASSICTRGRTLKPTRSCANWSWSTRPSEGSWLFTLTRSRCDPTPVHISIWNVSTLWLRFPKTAFCGVTKMFCLLFCSIHSSWFKVENYPVPVSCELPNFRRMLFSRTQSQWKWTASLYPTCLTPRPTSTSRTSRYRGLSLRPSSRRPRLLGGLRLLTLSGERRFALSTGKREILRVDGNSICKDALHSVHLLHQLVDKISSLWNRQHTWK